MGVVGMEGGGDGMNVVIKRDYDGIVLNNGYLGVCQCVCWGVVVVVLCSIMDS